MNIIASHAQNVDSLSIEVTDKVYILDSYWKAGAKAKFETDGYPSFLSIENGVITLFSKSRDKKFAYNSSILELVVTQENNDETKISFIGEKFFVNPSRPSFEITEKSDGNVKVHVFQTLGGYDSYFSGHLASDEEVNALMKYLESN